MLYMMERHNWSCEEVRRQLAKGGGLAGLWALPSIVLMSLWRAGATHAAAFTADATFLVVLTGIAGVAVLARPARLRRARVPISRALPRQWWPQDSDTIPLLAACAGAPLAIGAGVAVLLFR